jgi:hypothetical protein
LENINQAWSTFTAALCNVLHEACYFCLGRAANLKFPGW